MPTEAEEFDWDHRYDRDCPRPLPAEGDIDNNWNLIKPIANPDGAFNGGIDLVDNKVNKELAVCKRLVAIRGCNAHNYRRWRREMLVMRKLSHPNIPYYIDGFYTPERGSIYMQPCRLGNVSDWVSLIKTNLPFKMQEYFLWYILHEVAEAVLYMQTGFKSLADASSSHRDKVKGWVSLVHGDIRPDQIFMNNTQDDSRARALLGDFGFAQFIRPWNYTEVHDGPGAPSSSKAPEFPNEISDATDIFGLGATAQLYLLPSHKAKSGLARGWLTQLGVTESLDNLICCCVAVDALNRPTIWEVLKKLEWGLAEQERHGLHLSLLQGPLFRSLYPLDTAYPAYHM